MKTTLAQLSMPYIAVFAMLLHLKLENLIEVSWVGVIVPVVLGQIFTCIPSVILLAKNDGATVVPVLLHMNMCITYRYRC